MAIRCLMTWEPSKSRWRKGVVHRGYRYVDRRDMVGDNRGAAARGESNPCGGGLSILDDGTSTDDLEETHQAGEKVGLELSPAERKLLLTGLVFLYEDVEAVIRSTPPGGEAMLTLSDLEDLAGHVAGEANHAKSERTEKILSDIFDKIEELLDTYAEEDQLAGPNQARSAANRLDEPLVSPGPVIVPMPRRPGSEHRNYAIKMTPLQRKSLLDHANLSPGLMGKIERTPEGTQTVKFTRDELDVLYDEIGEAIASVRSPYRARLTSVSRKIEAFSEQECDEAFGVTPAEDQ